MGYKLTIDTENGPTLVFFESSPDKCPICNMGVSPEPMYGYLAPINYFGGHSIAQVILKCPMNQCKQLFIAYYRVYQDINRYSPIFDHVKPVEPESHIFENQIIDVSANFVEIYNQAYKAEQMGWTQAAGPAYRKSLEFLIKDYCCLKASTEAEKESIREKFLGKVISENISETRIKQIAKRATWLGNDETHYVRKWGDKDLQDLKKLINLTVSWIHMSTLSDEVEADMPD